MYIYFYINLEGKVDVEKLIFLELIEPKEITFLRLETMTWKECP